MTREEAIKILEEEAEFLYGGDEPYNRMAFDMAIEALQWQDRILTQIENIVLKEHGERKEA